MPEWNFTAQPELENGLHPAIGCVEPSLDLGLVLVVGTSSINRVVVCRTVERAGLRALGETPENACHAMLRHRPGTVVADGGAKNCDCDAIAPGLAAERRRSGGQLPFVILLATVVASSEKSVLAGFLDAVIAKPITPERLQPTIERLIESARGRGLA